MEEHMKQKLKIRNNFSITVLNLIQIQNLDFSVYLLIGYPNLKNFQMFIHKITKKSTKMYVLVIYFFTGMKKKTNQKIFDRIFKIRIEYQKKNKTDQKYH